jgi:hypothetical protein
LIAAEMASDPARFLNVDLDLRASRGLKELLGYFGSSVEVMHQTAQEASLELSGTRINDAPSLDLTLAKWVELVQSLPAQGRAIWDQSELRSMNVGIQSAGEPHAALFAISSSTVALLASVNAEIAFTIYAPIEGAQS